MKADVCRKNNNQSTHMSQPRSFEQKFNPNQRMEVLRILLFITKQ